MADCRAYELVSPVDKSSGGVIFGKLASDDGDALAYIMNSVSGPDSAAYAIAPFVSRRTATGWEHRGAAPPVRAEHRGSGEVGGYVRDTTPDFTRVYLQVNDPIDPDDLEPMYSGNVAMGWDVYGFDPFAGLASWVSRPLPEMAAEYQAGGGSLSNYVGSTDDGSHVLFVSDRRLVSHAPAGLNLYERAGSEVRLVGILPNDTPTVGRTPMTILPQTNFLRTGGAMSEDGRRIVWVTSSNHIYMREDGERTLAISKSRRAATAGTMYPASFVAMTRDGETVYFVTALQLTDDAPVGGSLYRWNRSDDSLSFVFPVRSMLAAGGDYAARLSVDGSRLYFYAGGQHATGAVLNARNLYLWDGELKLVATTPVSEPFADPRLRVTPNGRYALFTSRSPIDPSYASVHADGVNAIYLYDAETGERRCVSCRTDGLPSTAEALLRPADSKYSGLVTAQTVQPRNLSDDGSRVFFQTAERLVPTDTNGEFDVYEYEFASGTHRLISSGKGVGSELMGNDADGSNVFFMTADSLVGRDVDGGYPDAYVARVGGGFVADSPAGRPGVCGGDECQGPLGGSPLAPVLGSESFAGAGDGTPGRKTSLTIAGARQVRGAATTLRVRAPEAGRIVVSGKSVRRVARRVSERGVYGVRVKLRPAARRVLGKRGRLTAGVKVAFASGDGTTATRSVSVTFRRAAEGRR